MEQRDLQLIEKYQSMDDMLARLYRQHVEFEQQLEHFNKKQFLSPVEELERKTLQKKKLQGRDQIESILTKYRHQDHTA
jgi:uncharacterized protein